MLSLNTGCSGSLSLALNSSRKRPLGHDVAVSSTACMIVRHHVHTSSASVQREHGACACSYTHIEVGMTSTAVWQSKIDTEAKAELTFTASQT
jgi:hypothetical protein